MATETREPAVSDFKPYVADSASLPELTLRSIVLGAVAGVLFGVASVYLGLKIGLTTSASVPIAVIALAILRRGAQSAILERNMAQTIGSAGESIAAAVVFTLPALIFLVEGMSIATTFLVATLGGCLGVLMMIPLRRYLIVKEHGKLPYPEGTACAQVLQVGEKGGLQASKVFRGGLVGAAYNFCAQFLGILQKETHQPVRAGRFEYRGAEVAGEFMPHLLGVGYIIGYQTSAVMVAGGVMGFLVIIPMITLFGSGLTLPLYPSTDQLISGMDPGTIWAKYLRYIGAGAVATGGLFGLARAMPAIVDSFRASVGQVLKAGRAGAAAAAPRTERDMSIGVVVGGSLVLAAAMWFAGLVDPIGAVLVILFGFFFSVVSSRITGLVGSSSCPISGMTIATLMGTCFLFLLIGRDGHENAVAALLIGSIVCIALSNAGTTSQDLKTGFLVGATPVKQQIGLFIGVLTSVAAIGFTMDLMNRSETRIESAREVPSEIAPSDPLASVRLDASALGIKVVHDGAEYREARVAGVAGIPDGTYWAADDGRIRFRVLDPFSGIRVPESMLGETVTHEGREFRLARVHGLSVKIPNGFYFATNDGEILYKKIDGIGGKAFPAPQSRLMELVISGLLERKLPWDLVLIGIAIAIFMEILGLHSLTFAVGLYLPLSTTAPIFVGGLVRKIADRRFRKKPDDFHETEGTLYASGLIAGSALVGVLAAGASVLAASQTSGTPIDKLLWIGPEEGSAAADSPLIRLLTLVAFLALGFLLFRQAKPDRGAAEGLPESSGN